MIDLATIAFQNTAVVIYLGCGELQQLPNLPEKTQLVLVDADLSIIEQMQVKYTKMPNVKCLHRFVSNDGNKQSFNFLNLNSFNGFGEIKGVKELYPGIKLHESETVNTTDVAELIEELNIGSNPSNLLLLDIPSLNAQLLRRLKDSGQLYHFQTIEVYQQVDDLFEGEVRASELVFWLSDNGFFVQRKTTDDPDFALITAQINPLFTVNKSLQYELDIQSKKLNESKQKALKNEQMLADVKTRQAELENQLSKKDSENSRNGTELNKVIEQQKKQLEKLTKDSQQELKRCEEQRDALANQLDGLLKEIDSLKEFKQEVTELKKQMAAKTNLLNSKLLQLNVLQKHLADLERENKKVFSENAIHQKALTKAEAQLDVIKDLLTKPKAQQ